MKAAASSLLAAALLLTAPAAAAQHGISEPISPAIAARLQSVPAQLGSLSRFESNQSRAMFSYRGPALGPVITVVLSDVTQPVGLRALAETGRAEAIRAGLVQTFFEGRFSVPGQPGATTFFGDYLTNQGVKQCWIAEYDGVRITVSATILRAEDRRMVFDAIRSDLLGGAEVTGRVTAAEAN